MAIIKSLLDTDLYKFTMLQVVLHKFPQTHSVYAFRCRNLEDTAYPPPYQRYSMKAIASALRFANCVLQPMSYNTFVVCALSKVTLLIILNYFNSNGVLSKRPLMPKVG